MIIFYDKRTGDIFGTIGGRVHDKDEVEKLFIKPSNLSKKDIGRFVVPFKTKYKVEEVPVTEFRVVDKKTMRVEEVVVGKKKVRVGAGMAPAIKQADLILRFETGEESIFDYRLEVRNGEARFIKR